MTPVAEEILFFLLPGAFIKAAEGYTYDSIYTGISKPIRYLPNQTLLVLERRYYKSWD